MILTALIIAASLVASPESSASNSRPANAVAEDLALAFNRSSSVENLAQNLVLSGDQIRQVRQYIGDGELRLARVPQADVHGAVLALRDGTMEIRIDLADYANGRMSFNSNVVPIRGIDFAGLVQKIEDRLKSPKSAGLISLALPSANASMISNPHEMSLYAALTGYGAESWSRFYGSNAEIIVRNITPGIYTKVHCDSGKIKVFGDYKFEYQGDLIRSVSVPGGVLRTQKDGFTIKDIHYPDGATRTGGPQGRSTLDTYFFDIPIRRLVACGVTKGCCEELSHKLTTQVPIGSPGPAGAAGTEH